MESESLHGDQELGGGEVGRQMRGAAEAVKGT